MELIDNTTKTLRDDLAALVGKNDKLSIAAACFSIYAYKELKTQLDGIDELRFIFTSPTFVARQAKPEQREFYIPRVGREKSLYGNEFEVRLRNELTQKAIAKECADWIRKKVTFKSNVTNESMFGFINVASGSSTVAYHPINGFTTVDLGCERGNNAYTMITKMDAPSSTRFVQLFDSLWQDKKKLQDVTEEVIDSIAAVYKENSPDYIYFVALYNIFHEYLLDLSEDELPNEATGFKQSAIWGKLYDFQKEAAWSIISKLERYNGCILADSVGLGKTFTALAVIKYYVGRNKSVLVLCPKKLSDNWNTFKDNYVNNPIAVDRLNYDVLYHTDLSRDRGKTGDLDLARLNWGNYDLVVIDESHNFRNGGDMVGENGSRENRYNRLLNRVIRSGVKTKVLMLSATPVNNRFFDLRNQLQLAYEGNADQINEKLNTTKSVDEIFRLAQKSFNDWSRLPTAQRTTDALLQRLDFDFFELLDSVTIARSRKHIEKYYSTEGIGKFPERLAPMSRRPSLTSLEGAINYNQIFEQLLQLNLDIYAPSKYIFPSMMGKYIDPEKRGISQTGREEGIRRLMSINLLKRLESSTNSFRLTIERIQSLIRKTMRAIDAFEPTTQLDVFDVTAATDFDGDDQNTDFFTAVGRKVRIDLSDMDYRSWRAQLQADDDVLEILRLMIGDITPAHDNKLQDLLGIIRAKMESPINPSNKKVIVFTAFADTAVYLYENVSRFVKAEFGLETAMITGSVDGRSTAPKLQCDLNTVLTCFSPISKEKALVMPDNPTVIDVLIATDCISEGQNLQDCDFLINYDIHWNPVRIIQRFGRIDRIGSRNAVIQLVNFWPDLSLDEYIKLKERVETRMRISVMSSTGDDDPINTDEKGDLEYRKQQLQRLQDEVVDIEEMQSGVSIMDLGLSEFRLDLLDYIKHHPEIERSPLGLHAVVPCAPDAPPGVVFVLKNVNNEVNIDNQNRLHPYYMVYLSDDGDAVCNHLQPKRLLDQLRLLCRDKAEPDRALCRQFNVATRDGRDMRKYSSLLVDAISSIIDVKEQSDLDSLFKPDGTSALLSQVKGLDDFELVCFFVVV